jgi:hypothetical protein
MNQELEGTAGSRRGMRRRSWIGLSVCGLLAVSGCGGGEAAPPRGPEGDDPLETPATTQGGTGRPAVAGAASCALVVVYQGNKFWEQSVEVVPEEAGPLGTGVIPDCNDTGGEPGSGDEVELTALAGVPPEVALLWPGRPETVLVREGLENRLPPELRRKAPTCDPRDEPIRLAGPWLGLFGADGFYSDEIDLTSSHKVKLFAAESSAPRYERAFLVVRVPAGLERPLTRADVRFLWEGTIELAVTCRDGQYVAESVAAYPPR